MRAQAAKRVARRVLLGLAGTVGSLTGPGGGRILTYHGIDRSRSPISVTPETFAWQMQHLAAKGLRGVSLTQFQMDPLPDRVALTFDDGMISFVEQALPILHRHGFGATVFVVACKVGGHGAWERMPSIPAFALMDWTALSECAAAGVEIGSHSCDHPHLTRLPTAARQTQITDSKALLEDRLGRRVTTFCYPYGDWDAATADQVRQAGYTGAVTSEVGYVMPGSEPFRLPRLGMNRVDPHDDTTLRIYFRAALGGGLPLYLRLKELSTYPRN